MKNQEQYLIRCLDVSEDFEFSPAETRQYDFEQLVAWNKAPKSRMVAETIISCALVSTSVLYEAAQEWLAIQGRARNPVPLAVCLQRATLSKEMMAIVSGLIGRHFLPLPNEVSEIWQRITLGQLVEMREIRQALSLSGEAMKDFPPESDGKYIQACCRVTENPLPSARAALFHEAFEHPLLGSMPKLQAYLLDKALASKDPAIAEQLVRRVGAYIDPVTTLLTDGYEKTTLTGSDLPGLLAVSQALKIQWAHLSLDVQNQLRAKLLAKPTEYVFPLASELLEGNITAKQAGQLMARWGISLVSHRSWLRLRWDDQTRQIQGEALTYLQQSEEKFLPLLLKLDTASRARFLVESGTFFNGWRSALTDKVRDVAQQWLQSEIEFEVLLRPAVKAGEATEEVLAFYVEAYGKSKALPEVETWLSKKEPTNAWLIRILSIYQIGKYQLRPGLLLKSDLKGEKREYLLQCGYQLQPADVNSKEKVGELLPKEHYYGGYKDGQSRWRLLYSRLWEAASWRTALLECGHMPEAVLASLLAHSEDRVWLEQNLLPFLETHLSYWTVLIDVVWCNNELKNGHWLASPIWIGCYETKAMGFILKYWQQLSPVQQNQFKDYARTAFMNGSLPEVAQSCLTDDEKRQLLFNLAQSNNFWLPEGLNQWLPLFVADEPRLQLRNWLLRHFGKIKKHIWDERWLAWVEAFNFHHDPAFTAHIEGFLQDRSKEVVEHATRLLKAAKASAG